MPTPENFFAPHRATTNMLYSMLLILLLPFLTSAQQKDKKAQAAPAAPPILTRTTTRHETRRLSFGSTITILGAPAGSITIEGWNKSEVDITAEIELHASTEEDLSLLAQVNSFTVDKDGNHLRIITTGTHDKKFLKQAFKDFPKRLVGLPWKIDYHIRMPVMCDLDIDAGQGAINLSGVEGAISLKAVQSDAQLTLTGGIFGATIASGKVNVRIAARSWRGRGAEIRVAAGDVTVELPTGFSGDINADVLRTGKVENAYTALEPREDTKATERSLQARAGAGGAVLILTVGDGTINIKSSDK
ncbi:MAG TPA: hypothetical protein VGC91_05810 [Pyrinomonadaceae bacterium]